MTQRTRYFLVASGLVVAVGLGTGMVAYYNGHLPLGQASPGPDELAYIPSDTTAVAFADVRQIMDSEFRQRLKALMPDAHGKDQLLAETGVDLERDIDSVVAGLVSASPEASVVLLRGRFDQGRIEAAAITHGAVVEDYHGKRVLATPVGAGPDTSSAMTHAVAVLEPGLLALGTRAAIARAIDVFESHNSITTNAALMRYVSGVEHAGDAWVVGTVEAISGDPRVPAEVRSQLPALQWFALSAEVDRGVSGRLYAEARDQKAAEDLRAVVNGALAAAKMMSAQNAEMQTLMNSLQATGTGTGVQVSFTVPPEIFDSKVTSPVR